MTAPVRRLLTIGHSYCVRRNRELADALVVAGEQGAAGARWEVTVVAPAVFPGDLGPVVTTRQPDERAALHMVPVHGARRIHLMTYGRGLGRVLDQPWDVVHCWEEPFVLAAAQIARRNRGRAALVFATFQNIAKRYPPPFGMIERFAMRRASGWIAFGHTVASTLQERPAYVRVPHTVIPFGVDLQRFAPGLPAARAVRAGLGWEDEAVPVIGYLGRFVEEKGINVLLDALEVMDRLGARWRALFVGGGPLEPRVRAFASRFGARAHVVTHVSHDDVPAWLGAMDVLAAPSCTTPRWREQFGRMIVEAMACGVAVVGSDSGEIPQVLGGAGLVVREGDVAAWARALAGLTSDDGARRSQAARGRARAETEFAWPVVGRGHLDFLERVVAS